MLLVLVYHVWPGVLPAGYVGVDVFFVISGFLITGMLSRELRERGRIDFARFYLRRFRRLMPAASAVIATTMLLSLLLEPPFRYAQTAAEGVASALYWQNWLLAWRATDYLQAEGGLGPLTHYWSLSIEEQFYLVWPLVLTGAGVVACRRGWPLRTVALVVISLISAGSLASSITMSAAERPEAYFVTQTRIWELGLGAVLALASFRAIDPARSRLLVQVSLAAIVGSALLIPESSAYPGALALVPTLAAALFIHAGQGLDASGGSALADARPVRMLGDASYSIYLWHWPLVYFASIGSPGTFDAAAGLALITASLVLGWISWKYIETPFLHRSGTRPAFGRRAVAGTTVTLAVAIAAAGALFLYAQSLTRTWSELTPGGDYPGALVLSGRAASPPQRAVQPPVAALKKDLPVSYGLGCHVRRGVETPDICTLREAADEAPLIVLVGDSHAANWIPAVTAAARQSGWNLLSISKSACSLTLEPPDPGVHALDSCVAWSRAALQRLTELEPDLVLLGRARRGTDFLSDQDDRWVPGLLSMLEDVLARLETTADRIAVIADTPWLRSDPAYCLAENRHCTVALTDTIDRPDALLAAAADRPDIAVIDLRDRVCPDQACPAVIGNIAVWRDQHHLTASYARSTALDMQAQIERVLRD